MKFFSCTLTFLWALFAFVNSEAAPLSAKKIYVNQKDVQIVEKSLYVQIKGRTARVKTIHMDSQGLYVLNKDFIRTGKGRDVGHLMYYCQWCRERFLSYGNCKSHERSCPYRP